MTNREPETQGLDESRFHDEIVAQCGAPPRDGSALDAKAATLQRERSRAEGQPGLERDPRQLVAQTR